MIGKFVIWEWLESFCKVRLIYANRSKIKCEHTGELSAACSWQRISYCKVRLIARDYGNLCQRFNY